MVGNYLFSYVGGCFPNVCCLLKERDIGEPDDSEVAGPPFEFVTLECFNLTSELEGVAEIGFKCFSHVV